MSIVHRAGGGLAVVALSASAVFAAGAPSAETALAAVALVSDGVTARSEADPACPKVVFAPDGGVFPKKDDAYEATVQALARDCADLGAETILKVAVVGEGTRDSANGPRSFSAPLRVAVKDGEGHEVETRKIRLKVDLPDGVQKVSFNHLEENVSLPPAPAGGYGDWTVTVGFDPSASTAASVPAASKTAQPVKSSAHPAKPLKPVRAAALRKPVRIARAPAPVPAAAPAPITPQPDMRSQFQKLADARSARNAVTRDAALVEQRQLQLQEQAKAQARSRAQGRTVGPAFQPKMAASAAADQQAASAQPRAASYAIR